MQKPVKSISYMLLILLVILYVFDYIGNFIAIVDR